MMPDHTHYVQLAMDQCSSTVSNVRYKSLYTRSDPSRREYVIVTDKLTKTNNNRKTKNRCDKSDQDQENDTINDEETCQPDTSTKRRCIKRLYRLSTGTWQTVVSTVHIKLPALYARLLHVDWLHHFTVGGKYTFSLYCCKCGKLILLHL